MDGGLGIFFSIFALIEFFVSLINWVVGINLHCSLLLTRELHGDKKSSPFPPRTQCFVSITVTTAVILLKPGASFQLFLGGKDFFYLSMPPDYWKIGKKQHFICSNLTLFIVPFFLFSLFFSFLSLFSFLLSLFLFPCLGGGGGGGATAPQPPKWRLWLKLSPLPRLPRFQGGSIQCKFLKIYIIRLFFSQTKRFEL